MHDKHVKDLAISLGVIILIVIAFRAYFLYNKTSSVPVDSIYSRLALDSALMNQIQQIEDSINDRKEFVFTVLRDPLKQDLIVQTRLDLLREWEEMVRRMMRLSAVLIDNDGNQTAIIVWNGRNNSVKVGDVLNNRRITNITLDRVEYIEGGQRGYMVRQAIPPRPVPARNTPRQFRAENR